MGFQNENNDQYSSSNVEERHVRTEQIAQSKNNNQKVKSMLNVTLRNDFQTSDVVVNGEKNYSEDHEVDRRSENG